jgi:hypothetical protein
VTGKYFLRFLTSRIATSPLFHINKICNYSALALETALSDGYWFRGYLLNLPQISIRQDFGDIFFNGLNNYQNL